jgi:hypothetical protein
MGSTLNLADLEDGPIFLPEQRRATLAQTSKQVSPFVERMRGMGAGWGTVARMLKRCEHDVRMEFDPDYRPDPMLLRGEDPRDGQPAVTFRKPPAYVGLILKPTSLQAKAVPLMAAGPKTTRQIADLLGKRPAQASSILTELRTKGLIEWQRGGWGLTEAGRHQFVRLQEAAE